MSRNQLRENAPKLTCGLKWKIKELFLGNENNLNFEDFDQVIFKQKRGNFWLVEMLRDGQIFFGLVGIVKR